MVDHPESGSAPRFLPSSRQRFLVTVAERLLDRIKIRFRKSLAMLGLRQDADSGLLDEGPVCLSRRPS